MREILADAVFQLEGFAGRRGNMGRADIEAQVIRNLHHQRVQEIERVATGLLKKLSRKAGHFGIGFGQ